MRTMRGLPGRQGSGRGGGARAYPDGVPLTGLSGSYIRCADSAALSFSNDIEVVMRLKVTDWSAAANQTLVGKYVTTGNQRSWLFRTTTAGSIALTATPDGTAASLVTVTIAPSVALVDASAGWLRMRLDLTNGSNSVGTLETAADSGVNTEPSSWTANGSASSTPISAVYDGTAGLEIGTFQGGTLERLTGSVYRCIVRSGFSGTVVADFNSDLSSATGYTDAYGNVWAI